MEENNKLKKIPTLPRYQLTKEADAIRQSMKPEHLAFVDGYLSGMSPPEAYEAAGLGIATEATDQKMATRLLNMPKIRMYIDELNRSVAVRSAMSLEAIDKTLSDIASVDVTSVVKLMVVDDPDTGGKRSMMVIKNPEELTAQQRAAISSIKPLGENGFEVKFHDKLKAMEMLIKRKGGFTENVNQNITGGVLVFANVGNNGRGPKGQ